MHAMVMIYRTVGERRGNQKWKGGATPVDCYPGGLQRWSLHAGVALDLSDALPSPNCPCELSMYEDKGWWRMGFESFWRALNVYFAFRCFVSHTCAGAFSPRVYVELHAESSPSLTTSLHVLVRIDLGTRRRCAFWACL